MARTPRSQLAVLLAFITGIAPSCTGPDSGSEQAIVATVGEATLTAGQLTALLTHSPLQPDQGLALGLTSAWIDHALVLQSQDQLTSDPIAADATIQARHDSLVQRLIAMRLENSRPPTDAEVDSVGRRGDVRVFRLYAVAIPPGDTTARASAAALLEGLRSAALTAKTSPTEQFNTLDSPERASVVPTDLPAVRRGGLPPGLAEQIWGLNEGEISRPLLNQGLVQLFYRVPRPIANAALARWTRDALQQRADSVMVDSVLTKRHFTVPEDVAARMRSAFSEPGTITGDSPVATWDGGETTPTEALAWIRTLPTATRARQVGASDADLTAVAKAAGRREVIQDLLGSTDTAGVGANVRQSYEQQVAMLLADAVKVATGATASERAYSWSTAETQLQVPFRTEPSGLGAALRKKTPVEVDAVALRAALAEAVRVWQAPGSGPVGATSTPVQ